MIPLDWIWKLPRPERSGAISVVLHLTLFTALTTGLSGGADCMKLNLLACFSHPEDKAPTVAEIKRDYRYILLAPGGRGEKPCTCHFDLRYFGKEPIHLHSRQEESCDSEHYTSQEWTEPMLTPPDSTTINWSGILAVLPSGVIYRMNHGEGEFRLHCDEPTVSRGREGVGEQ